MIQKCGHPEAVCSGLVIRSQQAMASLPFPVRLEDLAEKWQRHVLYEPEVTSTAFFFLKKPRCTIGVTSGGKLAFRGFAHPGEAREALRRAYPVFLEFNR
uniref:TATA-box-binding protein n=2 Tax=Alexandrium monilatum TaxID=311494 RepID=A0A7S4V7L7_9DINO